MRSFVLNDDRAGFLLARVAHLLFHKARIHHEIAGLGWRLHHPGSEVGRMRTGRALLAAAHQKLDESSAVLALRRHLPITRRRFGPGTAGRIKGERPRKSRAARQHG